MEKHLKLFSTDSNRTAYENSASYETPYVSKVIADNSIHYNKPFVETRVVAKFNITNTNSPTQIMNPDYGRESFSKIWIDDVEQQSLVYQYTFNTLGEHEVKYELIDPTRLGDHDTETSGAFGDCYQLTSVIIPDNVIEIGLYTFATCTSLVDITFSSNLISIEEGAFFRCESLESIIIPKTVTSIGYSTGHDCRLFSGCDSLTSIVVEEGNSVYDSRDNCNAIIHTASNMLCTGCKNTVIPNTVTSITGCAFEYLNTLTSITIPSSVTSIGFQVFNGSGLNSITCLRSSAPSITYETFEGIKTGGTLYVPSNNSGYNTWMQNKNYYLGKYGWTKTTL